MNVHRSFAYSNKRLETMQMLFSGNWVNKLASTSRILLSKQKERITDTHNNLDGCHGHYAEWRKSISGGYILFDSTDMTFSK